MSLYRGTRRAKRWVVATAGFAVAVLAAGSVSADTLELRSGKVIEGKFLDGSPLAIRFRVDGKIERFATRDVLDIGFSDSGADESASPTPPQPPAAAPTPAAAPAPPAASGEPSAAPAVASDEQTSRPATETPSAASDALAQTNAPGMQPITLPAGTSLLVRMIDSVDSSTNKIGDPFQASLEGPLVVGNTVVAQKGADVYGKLAQAKAAGQLSGAAQLTLELTGIRINGRIVPIDSTDYSLAGTSRGKQSAERIGGGAILGAVIGAIAGGGKGAAVGAAVGGGAGTAAQVLTHGPQVRVPSETLLEFKLQQPTTVQIPD